MTLPATWAEKGKTILPLSGICVRKPQFSKPLDEEDDLRLSNMNFFKVSDLKLKKTITPVVYTGTIRERQMKNYIDYLSASLGSTLGNLERIVRSDWNGTEESMQTFGLHTLLNTPPIFRDKATFSVWFPEAKRKVLIPKFELSRFLSGNVKISRMLVDGASRRIAQAVVSGGLK